MMRITSWGNSQYDVRGKEERKELREENKRSLKINVKKIRE